MIQTTTHPSLTQSTWAGKSLTSTWEYCCNIMYKYCLDIEIRVWLIFGYWNIFPCEYSFVSYVCHFSYEHIPILICIIFWHEYIWIFIRIVFWYEYIRIFICIVFYTNISEKKSSLCAKKSTSEMAQIVHIKINIQRKFTFPLLCQLCLNFLLYHTSKIQHVKSNLKPNIKIWYKYICIFEYFPIWIYVRIIFVSFF